jgi:hypothetical protein
LLDLDAAAEDGEEGEEELGGDDSEGGGDDEDEEEKQLRRLLNRTAKLAGKKAKQVRDITSQAVAVVRWSPVWFWLSQKSGIAWYPLQRDCSKQGLLRLCVAPLPHAFVPAG